MKQKFWIVIIILLITLGASGYYLYSQKNHPFFGHAAVKKQKVYLIGFDGASWNLMKGPLKEGKLPHFQKLIQNGTYGPLKSFVPTKSPVLWTSIGTGKIQRKHGIGNFVAEKDGKMIPVSGGQRITKAFWNILTDYGHTVGVVNWWVTWPPEEVNGYMISDRYRQGISKKAPDLPLTYPRELITKLPRVGISMERYLEERKKYGLPVELKPVAYSKNIEQLANNYKTYWAQDKAVHQAAVQMLSNQDVEVFAVVFRIIDVSSHLFWTYLDLPLIGEMREKLEKGTLRQTDVDRIDAEFTKIIGPVYIYADEILGDILKHTDANTSIIICSDHGFKFEEGRYGHSSMKFPPDGIVILTGPAFRKNHQLEGATLLDITPTLLYLKGIPVGRDMDGKVLFGAFRPEFVKSNPPTLIASHDKGTAQKGEPISTEVDQEILEDLRSLGYIQ